MTRLLMMIMRTESADEFGFSYFRFEDPQSLVCDFFFGTFNFFRLFLNRCCRPRYHMREVPGTRSLSSLFTCAVCHRMIWSCHLTLTTTICLNHRPTLNCSPDSLPSSIVSWWWLTAAFSFSLWSHCMAIGNRSPSLPNQPCDQFSLIALTHSVYSLLLVCPQFLIEKGNVIIIISMIAVDNW